MQEKKEWPNQRLRELCNRAAQEQDTKRLMDLVKQIIDTYDAQQEREPKKTDIKPESRT